MSDSTGVIVDRTASLRAGVVGLGRLGAGVAVCLARRGRIPAVYDVRPRAAENLAEVPALAASAAAVARESDVVIVAVFDADQARAAISGPDGILQGAHDGLIVLLLSTVAVVVVHELAELAAARGVALLDCGVTPEGAAAEHGLVAIVGGAAEHVERARPVLDDFAKDVIHCGSVGAGMATKLARDLVTYGSWRAVHEAAALAEASGAGVDTLIRVIESVDPQGTTLLSLLRMRDSPLAEHEAALAAAHSDEATIRRYFECLDAEDWDGMRQLWHADGELLAVGARARHGVEEVIAFFSKLFDPWPAHRDAPTRLCIAGDTITAEVTFTGTTHDGREVVFDAIDVFDLRAGRIKRMTNWYDIAHARRVLAEEATA